MAIINELLITIICVLIIDQTDAMDSLKKIISRILTKGKIISTEYSLRPFDCSLCASWWANLIALLLSGTLSILNVAIILLFAIMTPIINDFIILIKDGLEWMINKIHSIFNKK